MRLTLKRKWFKENYTIGDLYIDGIWFSNTIEDKDRGLYDSMGTGEVLAAKKYCETAIPYGTYKVKITYSPKYKRNMPLLLNVNGFEGIRIHSGNTAKDSCGCLIVGRNTKVGMVTESRATYNRLFALMKDANDITIEITR